MVARQTLVRNGSRTQSEGRDQEGVSKARPLPNLTASPLNLVNVHRSVFKAYPWCRQPYVLRPEPGGGTIRAWRGMGDYRVASPILYEGQRRLALATQERDRRLSAQRRQATASRTSVSSPVPGCSTRCPM
jgi:hypothetical protein